MSPSSRQYVSATAGWTSRPLRLPSLSASLSVLLLLAIAAAVVALLLDCSSLFPALLLPPSLPSLAIVSLVDYFPPPSSLASTSPNHVSLTSYLRLVEPDHVILVSTSTDPCTSLSLYTPPSPLSAVVCRTIPPHCLAFNREQSGPSMLCVMATALSSVSATHVALVPIGVIVAPHLLATLASLTHQSHGSHAASHQLSSTSTAAFVIRSADVVMPPHLIDPWQSQQPPYEQHSVDKLYEAVLAATDQHVPSESTAHSPVSPRVQFELVMLPSALLRSVDWPRFVWSGIESTNAVWRQWLLYRLYSNSTVTVVDATQSNTPLLYYPSPSPFAFSPTFTPVPPVPTLPYNERIANEQSTRLTWKLGLARFAPYSVRGRCPVACHLIMSPSPSSQLVSWLFRRTSRSSHIMLIELSEQTAAVDDEVELFLCWARRVEFDGWLLAVRNSVTAERLKERGMPVVAYEEDEQQQPIQSEQQPGGATGQVRYRLWLNELTTRMLHYNVNVMLTNAAAIPLTASLFSPLRPDTNYHLVASAPSASSSSSTTSTSSRLPAIVRAVCYCCINITFVQRERLPPRYAESLDYYYR